MVLICENKDFPYVFMIVSTILSYKLVFHHYFFSLTILIEYLLMERVVTF